jgi:hypothetical protein
MQHNIKVTGWAEGAEPTYANGNASFILALSAEPTSTWAKIFEQMAKAVSARHPNVTYKLVFGGLAIVCPASLLENVVNGAKALVISVNQPANQAEDAKQQAAARAGNNGERGAEDLRQRAAKITF